jgi:hypothetical protein
MVHKMLSLVIAAVSSFVVIVWFGYVFAFSLGADNAHALMIGMSIAIPLMTLILRKTVFSLDTEEE